MEPLGQTGLVNASYSRTHDLAMTVIGALSQEGAPIGYGILACACAIGRFSNPDRKLEPEEEVEFIQNLMDWNETYWACQGEVPN